MFKPKGHLPLSDAVRVAAEEADPEAFAVVPPPAVAALSQALAMAARPVPARPLVPIVPITRGGETSDGRIVDYAPKKEAQKPAWQLAPEELADLGRQTVEWENVQARRKQASEEARKQLRQAFGDGDLAAWVVTPDGQIVQVGAERWRTTEGRSAMIGFRFENSPFLRRPGGPAFVLEADLRAWLGKTPAAPPALPAFTYGAAFGRLTQLRAAGQPLMTERDIRALIQAEYSGEPTDPEIRKLMKIWPNRKRGPQPRNAPKPPRQNSGKPQEN